MAETLLLTWNVVSGVEVRRVPPFAMSANFDAQALGAINKTAFYAELGGSGSTAQSDYDNMTIVANPSGPGRVTKIFLPKNSIRGSTPQSGVVLPMLLPGIYDRASISYDIYFPPTFDWSQGGKLPGLLGVRPGVPPSAPAGGHPTSDGWSGRLMWYGTPPTARVQCYMYHPGQSSQYGDDIFWGAARTVAGAWFNIRVYYQMNTLGQSDGILRGWMNGTQYVNLTDFVYRTEPDVHINYLEWDVFRGGGDMSWASAQDDNIYIDNMLVTVG